MTDGAVGSLAEIAALGVLEVGAARYQYHLGVGQQGSRQGAAVGLFIQVGEDEPLPVEIQNILGQMGIEDQPRPRGERLHEELYLGVMAEGLEMPDAYGAGGDPFLVEDAPLVHLAVHAEAVGNEPFQKIGLDVPHEAGLDLGQLGVPRQMEGPALNKEE